MVTDKKAIEAARDLVISEEAYIAITWKDFTDFCPAPDGLIHVCGKDVQEVLDKMKAACNGLGTVRNLICIINSETLTMKDLTAITGNLPTAETCKRGMAFLKPREGAVEVYLFVGRK